MSISGIRARGKAVLRRVPALYPVAKRVFVEAKLAADRRQFKRRYPAAEYVRFSNRRLAGLAKEGYSSQYGQDFYLWTKVLRGKTPGFLVDIGGNHPAELSNSRWLEQHGWRGVACDPLAVMAPLWREQRPATTFYQVAISSELGKQAFIEIRAREGWEHALSGFKGNVRAEDLAMYDHVEYLVETAPLSQILDAGTDVDLVMVDVEGAEHAVMEGVDLEGLRPDVVMIENISILGGGESIREYMIDRGYALVARIGGADDVFVRP